MARGSITAAILAGILLLAACGSSKPSADAPTTAPPTTVAPATTTTAPIGKAAFIALGDAACNATTGPTTPQPNRNDLPALVQYMKHVVGPFERAQMAKMKALGYPAGDAKTLQTIYDCDDGDVGVPAGLTLAMTDRRVLALTCRLTGAPTSVAC